MARSTPRTLVLVMSALAWATQAKITPCSPDDTNCDCERILSAADTYKMTCSRESLAGVPKLTKQVEELHMSHTSLTQTTIRQDSFREAENLKTLTIESCDISTVDTSAFNSLYSLQRISLARNNIKSLPNQVFANLNFLLELDLSYNSIDSLKSETFDGLRNLNSLDLSYNSLQLLPANIFQHLTSLKVLRLESTLLGIEKLPDDTLSHNSQLEELHLERNKIRQLQPVLFAKVQLKKLFVNENEIKSISADLLQNLNGLSELDISNNPFICNCQLVDYKSWIDGMTSRKWSPDKTGSCSSPSELYNQYISTLPLNQFTCTETTTPTTSGITSSMSDRMTQHRTAETHSTERVVTTSEPQDKAIEVESIAQTTQQGLTKSLERSVIIGCSIGGAFLLISVNVMIICCVRWSKRHTGTRKMKYIIRPDELEGATDEPVEDTTPYKQPTVNGTGPGYIISNGVSGFYHTGSRSRLHSAEQEHLEYNVASHNKLKGDGDQEDVLSSQYENSVFQITMPPESRFQDELNYSHAEYLGGSYCPPTSSYPPKNMSYRSTNPWSEHSVCSPDSFRRAGGEPFDTINNSAVFPHYIDYMESGDCDFTASREVLSGLKRPTVKFSTGSTDSGVHSNSPYITGVDANNAYITGVDLNSSQILDIESMSPVISHRNASMQSPNSKRIRNETYV